ncbi:MAG: DUF4129 domain-containing protein [Planctomycetota bacterium]
MVAIVVGIVAAVMVVGAAPLAALMPHRDPEGVSRRYDAVSVFWEFSEALDHVLAREAEPVRAQEQLALLANIPEGHRDTVTGFLSSGGSLAELILAAEANLDSARIMLAQSLPAEAQERSEATQKRLVQAYVELRAMEVANEATSLWFLMFTEPEGSLMRQMHAEVEGKLAKVRSLLDMLSEMRQGLGRQTEIIAAVAEGRLFELEEVLKAEAAVETAQEEVLKAEAAVGAALEEAAKAKAEAETALEEALKGKAEAEVETARAELLKAATMRPGGSELMGGLLAPTALTLSVEPLTAFVGDTVQVRGLLSSRGQPLFGKEVTVLLNGSPELVMRTDRSGAYQGELALPYQYVSEMRVQALYNPQGADLGLYLGSSSPEITIVVLFYDTRLTVRVPERAYPGRAWQLEGSLSYGDNPAPQGRSLLIYWDGRLAAGEAVGTAFSVEVPVAGEESLGRHAVALYVPAQGRYAPARASAEIEVVKVVPVIQVDAPGIVLLPLDVNLRGRVYSALGPLQDASLRIVLGDREVSVQSQEDGTFSARLRTGMSLTLMGTQELRVIATPQEPWHKANSLAVGLLVINPATIAGLVFAVAVPVFLGVSRFGRRAARLPRIPGPQPAAVPVTVKSPPVRPAPPGPEPAPPAGVERPTLLPVPPGPEMEEEPPAILLALYRGVLRLVQAVTAILLRPSHTLREFVQECAPRLGPGGDYLYEFTLMVERVLYSTHRPGETEAARSRALSQSLREGLKDENT